MKKSIVCILIVFIITLLSMNMFCLNPKTNSSITIVEDNQEFNKSEMLTIYVDDGDGYKKYTKDNKWPSGYSFNKDKSICVNDDGNELKGILSFDSTNNIATVRTKETAYCYLYFVLDGSEPTCELYVLSNKVTFKKMEDDKTSDSNLQYTINTTNSNPSTFNNTNSVSISVLGNYYGYVKDEAGNIGKCSINVQNTKSTNCTVISTTFTKATTSCHQTGTTGGGECTSYRICAKSCGNSYEGTSCIGGFSSCPSGGCYDGQNYLVSCTCESYAPGTPTYGTTTTIEETTDCNSYGSPFTCNSSTNGQYYTTCTPKTYNCSNNLPYSTKSECESQECGKTCDTGYIQSGNYCYK